MSSAGKKVLDDQEASNAGEEVLDDDQESSDSGEEFLDQEFGPVVIMELRNYGKQKVNERTTAMMLSDPENITEDLEELQKRPFIMSLPAPSIAARMRKILLTEDTADAQGVAKEGAAARKLKALSDDLKVWSGCQVWFLL
ncbi:uncharacterized protein LOC141723291 [Apium graveolens]|uniref:uncharacterized protein LOC141723291 n=1 Tax=Apium graveolens TaxID=4045 RepID=UPI003D7B105F